MFGKIKVLPIIVILVFLVCFVSLIADTEETGHVSGIVRVLNWQTGKWEDPNPGEQVHVIIFLNGGWYAQEICTITNGNYDVNFSGYQYASSCTRVDVYYRNQAFTEDFNYSSGTVVDINFIPVK